MKSLKKFFGFTLAEVLVTLGVIGVVSAMTIPILVNSYQKTVWTNQLKKSYTTLQQGFKMMLANEGVDLLSQTTVFNSIGNACPSSYTPDDYRCKNFYNNLYNYFKITEIKKFDATTNYKTKYLNINNNDYTLVTDSIILLSDGTFVWGGFTKNINANGIIATFNLDVNGKKLPNIYGRDIFYFIITDNGYIYPWGSIEESKHNAGNDSSYYWRTSPNGGHYCDPKRQCYGNGCTARVLEEGKMNY